MEKTAIIYSTDTWHTPKSKQFIGVFENKETAINRLSQQYNLSEEQKINLWLMNQTQTNNDEETNYEGEFILEEHTMNVLRAA